MSVTTGIGAHPTWAAAPAAAHEPVGTINAVCWLPVRLSQAALVNAVATVAEAKAQALFEAGVPGTGTPTDAVAVLCPPDGPAEPFGGPRSAIGGALARAVHGAVRARPVKITGTAGRAHASNARPTTNARRRWPWWLTTEHRSRICSRATDAAVSSWVTSSDSSSSVRETVTSDDGLVAVTVSAQGALVGLVIADSAYRELPPAELAATIVATTAAATAKVTRAASEVLAPVLPPDTDPEALLRGTADLSAAELKPTRADAVEPDETFEDKTWMQSGGTRHER